MKTATILLFLAFFCKTALSGQVGVLEVAANHKAKADSLLSQQQFTSAILSYNKALNIYQNQRPVPYAEVVALFNSLATTYRKAGKMKELAFHQKRAIEIAESKLIPTHYELARAYNGYGISLLLQGEYNASLIYLHKALDINQKQDYPGIADNYLNIGLCHQYLDHKELAFEFYQKSLKQNIEEDGLFKAKVADNYNNLGTLAYSLDEFGLSLTYFDTVKIIYDSILPPNHADLASLYNNISVIYNAIGDQKNAVINLKYSIEIFEAKYGKNHLDVANPYSNMGLLLVQGGDFDKAIAYFEKAYFIRADNLGDRHVLTGRTCSYLGFAFLQKGDLDQAYDWLMKAKKIYDGSPAAVEPADREELLNDLGLYYQKIGNTEQAIEFLQKSLQNRKQEKEHLKVADSYARIGDVYLEKKEFDTARSYFFKALKIRQNKLGKKHQDVADTFRRLALTCPLDGVCSQEWIDSAFWAIDFNQGLGVEGFSDVNFPIVLLEVFQAKAAILTGQYAVSKSQTTLREADQSLTLGINLIEYIKANIEDAGSRQALLDKYFLLYENAITIKCLLKEVLKDEIYWKEAFDIAEKSNATLLLEALQTVDAERFAGIEDSLLHKERRLKIDLAHYEKLRFEEQLKGPEASQKRKLELANKIFNLQSEYSRLMAKFKHDYPKYFELKYAAPNIGVNDIQDHLLRPDQTMLTYFVGEESIVVFVISKTDYQVVTLKKDFPLEIWVEEFRHSIYAYSPVSKDVKILHQKFANIGHELYQAIFQPIEPFLKNKSLVIVPGGVLGYLPFDALLASPAKYEHEFDRNEYLVLNYQISYCYSATLLREMMKKETKGGGFLAFAPSFPGEAHAKRSDPWRAAFSKLRYNQIEANNIHKIMGGEVWLDSFATEERFLQLAPLAKIIHLATHGKASDFDSDYSYLAFYQRLDSIENELLFVKNLYNMRIHAALVVLSACETGIGELHRGEGIVSLARGFSYAGAASIITTLWSIDDRASSTIMVAFYENLKAGMTKDAALREAKLAYLKSKKNSNGSHPLFWAAFVPVGNMEPVSNGTNWWLVGGGVFLLGGLLVLLAKRRR